jgi:hypothetical protein
VILLVDLDVHVLRQLRPDEDRRERGVPPGRLIEGGDPDESMHAGFGRAATLPRRTG